MSLANGTFGYLETFQPWQTHVWSFPAPSCIHLASNSIVAFMVSGTLANLIPSFFPQWSSKPAQTLCMRATRNAPSCLGIYTRGTVLFWSTKLAQSTREDTTSVPTLVEQTCIHTQTLLSLKFLVRKMTGDVESKVKKVNTLNVLKIKWKMPKTFYVIKLYTQFEIGL